MEVQIMTKQFLLFILIFCSTVIAQTKDAYETDNTSKKGLLDPSHFSMHNSVSLGMASSGSSGLKSQSLYSTMLQYKFHAPVTVNLNFGLPIHSTISSAQNLNVNNLQSMEYFKNMPISASFSWQPTEKMLFQFNFERNTYNNSYYGYPYSGLFYEDFFHRPELMVGTENADKK